MPNHAADVLEALLLTALHGRDNGRGQLHPEDQETIRRLLEQLDYGPGAALRANPAYRRPVEFDIENIKRQRQGLGQPLHPGNAPPFWYGRERKPMRCKSRVKWNAKYAKVRYAEDASLAVAPAVVSPAATPSPPAVPSPPPPAVSAIPKPAPPVPKAPAPVKPPASSALLPAPGVPPAPSALHRPLSSPPRRLLSYRPLACHCHKRLRPPWREGTIRERRKQKMTTDSLRRAKTAEARSSPCLPS